MYAATTRSATEPSAANHSQELLFQRSFYLLHYSHHVRFTLSVVLLIRNGVFHGFSVNVSNLTVDVGGRVTDVKSDSCDVSVRGVCRRAAL